MGTLTNISSASFLFMFVHAWFLMLFRVFFWERWEGRVREGIENGGEVPIHGD